MVNVGWVGNYRRSGKNFGQAYRICKANDWNLLIAGGLDSGLYVEHTEMPNFYNDCDVLLVTSVYEAHPLVVYEALAMGVPVVIGKWVGDCFRNNVMGIVYYDNVDSDENITNAVNAALQYKDELSESGMNCIQSNWTWENVAQQYLSMFQRLTDKEKPHITFITDMLEWSWGHMANEIKKHVYPNITIRALNEKPPQSLAKEKWEKTDLILNHPWQIIHGLGLLENIPQDKHVLCVNGPAFLNPIYGEAWKANLDSCRAITSVSLNIIDRLRFTGKPLFYATRAVNVNLFKPTLNKEYKYYLNQQEETVKDRLSKLGVMEG